MRANRFVGHMLLMLALSAPAVVGGCAKYYMKKADKCMLEQRYMDALEFYSKALERKDELADDSQFMAKLTKARYLAAHQQGQQLASKGSYVAAIARFEECLRIKPDYQPAKEAATKTRHEGSSVMLERALQCADGGMLDEAMAQARSALGLDPENLGAKEAVDSAGAAGPPQLLEANALLEKARKLMDEKRWPQAVEALESAISKSPNHLRCRAERHRSKEKFEQAVSLADAGEQQLKQKDLGSAMASFKQAMETWPYHPTAQSRLDQARSQLEKVNSLYGKAKGLAAQGQWDEAMQTASAALQMYPQHAPTHDLADSIAQKAAESCYFEGRRLLAARDLDAAEVKFERALTYLPDIAGAKEGLAESASARAREAENRNLWGSALLWYMDAAQWAGKQEYADNISQMQARIASRVGFTVNIEAPKRLVSLPADLDAFRLKVATAVARNKPAYLRVVRGQPAAYSSGIVIGSFTSETVPIRSENRTHRYEELRDVPNPEAHRLRVLLARANNQLDNLINDRAHEDKIIAKKSEIRDLERHLSQQPARVRTRVQLDWPYRVHFCKKTFTVTAELVVKNAATGAAGLRENLREAAGYEFTVTERANPEIGLRADQAGPPDDATALRGLLDGLATQTSLKIVGAATASRLGEARAAADKLLQQDKPTEAIEAYVDVYALLRPSDEKAAQEMIEQLRSQSQQRRTLHKLLLTRPPVAQPQDSPDKAAAQSAVVAMAVELTIQNPASWNTDGTWENYTLVFKDDKQSRPVISFVVPAAKQGKIRPEDISALLVMGDADKKATGAWQTREVSVSLPQGAKLAGKAPAVTFMLVKLNRPAAR